MAAIPLLRADFGPPAAATPPPQPVDPGSLFNGLAGYIRTCFQQARDHRRNAGVDDRMLRALRAVRGEYDAQTLSDIEEFGGSRVYARITASKVRSCAALLREVYTTVERPWALDPTPEPSLAGPTLDAVVREKLTAEVAEVAAQLQQMAAMHQQATAAGDPAAQQLEAAMQQIQQGMTVESVRARSVVLRDEISQLRMKVARDELRTREDALDDVLTEGGFYDALWTFLGDIATFPFAVIKGPITEMTNRLVWGKDGKPTVSLTPTPVWKHCSPFDVFFAPWSQKAQDGYIIHRERITRASMNALRGAPNYNTDAIDRILANWSNSNCDWYDYNEAERADLEQRVNDNNGFNRDASAAPLPMLSFYGPVPREHLVSWGVPEDRIPVGTGDLNVFAYLVANEVIGVTLNPHPRGDTPFYSDSFERVAGSCYGHAIPDLLDDVQSVGNAALRALTNNLAMASGPMGWVNEDRVAENAPDINKLHPWKIFRFQDPISSVSNGSEKPMEFFMPDNNVEQLFMVYERMQIMADELSTIPRYMQGNGQGVGGAGRTAAGLSMLMEAGGRTIKQTVGSIDNNVVERAVTDLNVYLALVRPDVVQAGDINVVARGATELMQKETLRMRRLEFLNITNNPVDMQIVGAEGRFHLLRELARDLQLPVRDSISFSEQEMQQLTELMKAQMMQQLAGGGPNGNTPPPGGGNPNPQAPQNATAGVARGADMNPGR